MTNYTVSCGNLFQAVEAEAPLEAARQAVADHFQQHGELLPRQYVFVHPAGLGPDETVCMSIEHVLSGCPGVFETTPGC